MAEYKVLLLWVVCLCFEVVMTGCEVVWVNRNVTDSFRVGKDGCTNDENVCTSTSLSATCQPDGSCLCKTGSPTFRNPVIEGSGLLIYGSTYGCINNDLIRLGVGTEPFCHLKPFQVIPYSHTDPATTFTDNDPTIKLQSCSVRNIRVKFPNNATEMELRWLNESYVNIDVSNNDLHFKWKRSVPDLQGTIITFNLRCSFGQSSHSNKCLRAKVRGTWTAETTSTSKTSSTPMVTGAPRTITLNPSHTIAMTMSSPTTSVDPSSPGVNKCVSDKCLRAKVRGTWPAETASTTAEPTVTTTKINSLTKTLDTTSPVAKSITATPETTVYAGSDDESCADTTSKVFIALFSISVVVIVILGIMVGYLWKDRKRIQSENLRAREMEDIGEKGTGNLGETSIYDEVVDSGKHNDGMKEDSFPSTGQKNSNERLSDHKYEEALNYEPLRRNLPQDENEEHNYQSLTTSQKRE